MHSHFVGFVMRWLISGDPIFTFLQLKKKILTFPYISEATGAVEFLANRSTPWGSILTIDLSRSSLAPPGTVVEGAAGSWTANSSATPTFAVSWNRKYHDDPKFSDIQVSANSVDPDGAVWYGSKLFAIQSASFGCITL